MDWSDEGIVLAARPHGEGGAVVQLLTRERGRHAGFVRGGASRRGRPAVEPGNRVAVAWHARLAEHLGTMTLEVVRSTAAELLHDPRRLAALASACALAGTALPEREPHGAAFAGTAALLDALAADPEGAAWPAAYVRWEVGLLGALGFGLDLGRCAATGARSGLAYVCPQTGRAVSRAAAGASGRDRLLPLPAFLAGGAGADADAVGDGLRLTGHFLVHHVYAALHRPLPPARARLLRLFGGGTGGAGAMPAAG